MIVKTANRCCTWNRIFIFNLLVLLVNIILYIYNFRYFIFTFQRPIDDYSKEKGSKCNITNPVVICPYNWTSLEASVFASPMDSKERQLFDRMFRTFVETVEAANVTYFMMAGTLLGSIRHHGPIPWDDDLDVIVKASDEDILLKVLSKLGPDFKLYTMKPPWIKFWKLFPSQAREVPGHDFRAPSIDIFLYLENKTHVWTPTLVFQDEFNWLKRDIFPLRRRPYGELFLPAPCNSLAVINATYNISMCHSRRFNHFLEEYMDNVLRISCDHLANIYPFVKRSNATNESSHFVKETLMIGNLTIREVMVENYC